MSNQFRTYILLAFVLLFTGILYYPSLFNDFTTWDDPLHVIENPTIQSLSVDSLLVHFEPSTRYMYHPLTMISYAVDWNAGGGTPFAFHLTNYLFHLFNVILVFFFVRQLSGKVSVALFVALLFGIHPMNVETVAWVSARKDILFSFFYLAGATVYIQSRRQQHTKRYAILVYIFFVLGLLSKPTMVVFPLMLVAIDWWIGRPFDRNNIFEKLIMGLVSLIYGLLNFLLSASDTTGGMAIYTYTIGERILLACYSLLFYGAKLLFPFSFSAVYSYPHFSISSEVVWYFLSPVFLVLLFIGIAKMRKEHRFLIFGFVLYVLPLLLVMQVLPFHNSSLVADRYAYISSIGIFFIIVIAFQTFLYSMIKRDNFLRIGSGMMLGIIIFFLSLSTVQRISVWKNGETLFSDVISKNKNVWLAYANRANARISTGKYEEAILDCDVAIGMKPGDSKLYYNRGNAKSYLLEYTQAISDYDSAIAYGPTMQYVLYNKGIAFHHLNKIDSALKYYKLTIQKDPNFANAYSSVGQLLLQDKNNPLAALPYLDTSITKASLFADPYYQRGIANYRLGRYYEALEDCKTVLLLQPGVEIKLLSNQINHGIDSVSSLILRLDEKIVQFPYRKDLLLTRAKYYEMLGDSIRSDTDINEAKEMQKYGEN